MARVVADLVDVWSYELGEAVVFLEIDREIGLGLAANLRQGFGVLLAIDGDADNVRARIVQGVHLFDGGSDILRLGRGHALDRDGIVVADRDGADLDGACWVAGNFHCARSFLEACCLTTGSITPPHSLLTAAIRAASQRQTNDQARNGKAA